MRKPIFSLPAMKSILLVAGIVFAQFTNINAQTPAINLQNGVELYNALREYNDGLKASTLTEEQVSDVKNRADKATVLLDKVVKEGNAEEIRTARYFKTNLEYEYGFILGMKGENARAFEVFKRIEPQITQLSASSFPMQYVYFEKNYTIKWDNFASTQAEYYTGFAEIAYNLKKYEDAVRLNRLALAHPNTTNWLKYVAYNKMLDLYAKSTAYMTEIEYLDYSVASIKAYQLLTDSDRETVTEYKYPTAIRGTGIILDKALQNSPAALARAGEAAMAGSEATVNEKTLQLFELCYKNKQAGDANFHQTAEAYARKAASLSASKALVVGVSATDRMAAAVSTTDCSALDGIIEKYTYWKETTKAREFSKKRDECLANVEKARKKAERQARRANSNFNLYVGTYIFPILQSNPKRDYGGVVNFVFKKTAWEFSYLQIKQQKENVFDLTIRDIQAKQTDLPRWDGFYAHVQPKFFKQKNGYVGILAGYAEKNFGTFTSNATRVSDGAFSTETFNPKVTQYIGMVNMGGLALWRGVGADFYCGIGATYNQWKSGNSLNPEEYNFENLILENRKDTYFSLIIRAGLTLGLNFGRGNM